jgi:hypothetical protein
MLDTSIAEDMNLAIEECNEKARRAKSTAIRNSYIQEASQIKKMLTQIQHRTTMLEERKVGVQNELSILVHYCLENNLITCEKLQELRDLARQRAQINNAKDEEVIKKIYGDFESVITNRSKKDPTAYKAIRNI